MTLKIAYCVQQANTMLSQGAPSVSFAPPDATCRQLARMRWRTASAVLLAQRLPSPGATLPQPVSLVCQENMRNRKALRHALRAQLASMPRQLAVTNATNAKGADSSSR